ncbi:hypothetical protein [Paenibacillus assamensis]|uniref:hypothetical protein n=1 Tax=Paenibacillus assamensis TaxID=311244 RepID=UPI0012FA82A1|nr:hypothetical protein [Paenibacillus assamensis]
MMRERLRMFCTRLTLLVVITVFCIPVATVSASSKGGSETYTIKKVDGSGKMKPAYYSTAWKFQFPKEWEIGATVVDKKRNMMIVMYAVKSKENELFSSTKNKEYGLASYDLTTGERVWKISLSGLFEGDFSTYAYMDELEIQHNGEIIITGYITKEVQKMSETGDSYFQSETIGDAILTVQSATGKITRKIVTPVLENNDFTVKGPWLLSDGRLMTASSLDFDANKTLLRYYDRTGELIKSIEHNGHLAHFSNGEYVYIVKYEHDFNKLTVTVRDEAGKVLRNYTYNREQGKLKKNQVENAWKAEFLPDGKFVVSANIYKNTKEQPLLFKRISVFSKHGKRLWMHNVAASDSDRDSLYYTIIGDRLYVMNYKASTLAEIHNGKMLKPVKLGTGPLSERMTILGDGMFYTQKRSHLDHNKGYYYVGAVKPVRNILQVTVPDHTSLKWTDSTRVLLFNYSNNQMTLLRVK